MDIRQIPSRIIAWFLGAFVSIFEIQPPEFCEEDKPLNTRTPARLRACAKKMRRDGILAIAGYTPPPRGESVQALWNRYGWIPPREELKLEPATAETEIVSEVVALKRKARG